MCRDKMLKAKRYEFARGFITNTITILDSDTRHAVYHLSDFDSTRRLARSTPVCLRNARTQEMLATIRPRRLLPDVITLHSPTLPVAKKVRLGRLFRGLSNSSSVVNFPNPGDLGLSKGTVLFWKITSDRRSMTLHSAVDGEEGTSSILAYASFAQSIASGKLVSIEVLGNIVESLLVYIIISASVMEVRVRKEHQKEEERLFLQRATATYPVWTLASFGASSLFL